MTSSFHAYLLKIRASIREVSVAGLQAALAEHRPLLLLDVREADEIDGGVIEGAETVPRGLLELRIESLAPDRDAAIAVYCAGGVRSALAAHTLTALGYTDVVSFSGGIRGWIEAGLPLSRPERLQAAEMARYARQVVLPQVGERGQLRLLNARVLCVGAGGLGSPAAMYLAAAGVGTLGIVDNDVADTSNLQRQILHTEDAIGVPKVESARQTLSRLNSQIEIVTYQARLTAENVMEIFDGYDLIVDATDNFPSRYLINDACVLLKVPNVHGSIFHFEGQCTVFNHAGGPCYRCLYPEPPPPELAPNCAEAGVLGAMCGVIGSWQAVEAVKVLLGVGDTLAGRLLTMDAMGGSIRELRVRRNPDCPMCGDHPTITAPVDHAFLCADGN